MSRGGILVQTLPAFRIWSAALLAAAFLLASAAPARAQAGLAVLQIIITVEGESQPTDRELTVLLLNEWGEVEAAETTHHGIVQFSTRVGLRGLRISGPGIEPFDDQFVVEGARLNRIPVQVHARARVRETPPQTPETVAAVRLKIPGNARKEYDKAQELVVKQDFAKARAHLQKAVELYPDYDLAFCGLGRLAVRDGDRAGARQYFEKAVSLNQNYAEPRRHLAALLLGELKYAEAEPVLLKLTQLEPSNAWALSSLALSYFNIGNFDNAVLYARKVHTLPHRAYTVAHLIAASALEAASHRQEAIEEYRLYLQEDPAGAQAGMARQGLARLGQTGPAKQ